MKETIMGWKGYLARVVVLCLALAITMRVAMARDGESGGRARSFVTIAGTVTGVPAGTTRMQFTFRRSVQDDGGIREERCVRDVQVAVDGTGAFTAEVPLDVPTSACVEGFFDGSDVRVDVAVGGVPVVEGGAVNPVPYAIHANVAVAASRATPDSGLARELAAAVASVPPGTIVAYGGERVPDGWALCDGSQVPREGRYAGLFAAVGTSWGAGDGRTTFHLPDLRGRFLRGVDGSPTPIDQDRSSRFALHANGNIGARVGSYQLEEFKEHTHGVRAGTGSDRAPMPISVFQYYFRDMVPPAPSLPAGGRETRPVNAAVNYIVRL